MELAILIFVILTFLFSATSLIILIYIARLFVRYMLDQKEFFGDMMGFVENTSTVPPVATEAPKSKTWDEKYEEELAFLERRRRGDSGLTDLPMPKANYGEGPAANPKGSEGMILKNREN